MVKFIISSKNEKLDRLQEIIGFTEVAKVRELLKKSAGRITRHIKSANYDNKKNAQQSIIIDNLNQNAQNDKQLLAGVNELIKPLKLGKKVGSLSDIQEVLKEIRTKEDTALVEQIAFHTKIEEGLSEVVGNIDAINESYKSYYKDCSSLRKDQSKIRKLQLLELLKEGRTVLMNDVVQENYCPLCQQGKNKVQLIEELNKRVKELEELEEEKDLLDKQCQELEDVLQVNVSTIVGLLKDKHFKTKENSNLAKKVSKIEDSLETISKELGKDLYDKNPIRDPKTVSIGKEEISFLIKQAKDTASSLTKSKKSNIKFEIYNKLLQSVGAYNEYQKIQKEVNLLTRQEVTFKALFTDFVKRQEEALNTFLTMFSADINGYYVAMNPDEKVEDIKLSAIKDKKSEDLVGVTIEYRFFDKAKRVPSAYLSESHVNCLGLSFFLASVKAFNKENGFIVLDDVISSFDGSHRARFAQLLTDKFNEYQILLLTHEREFFDLVSSEVKGKGWLIQNFVWSTDSGTCVEEGMLDSKERILKKFADKNIDGLGNDIRIYAEKVMKEIACNIEAQVVFKYNELNEKRMAPELLDAVHSQISKKGQELRDKANIKKVKGMPMFIGNTTSHDNDFKIHLKDLGVMWEGISNTIQAFYCDDCDTFISVRYFDNVKNQIRCKCGSLTYDWQK